MGSVFLYFTNDPFLTPKIQSNLLVSYGTPPRACLAGFSCITTVLDSDRELLYSAQTGCGTVQFMSPELLLPEEFGQESARPTLQADIYAFGLVIFQVRKRDYGYRVFSNSIFQVLTGGIPFPGVRGSALAYHVFHGMRPPKPVNASTIGLSDSLWAFVQNCWHHQMELRPVVGEVVTHLCEAADSWVGLMPPSSLEASDITLDFEGPVSDSEEPSEFNTLTLLLYCPQSDGTDFFPSSSSDVSESSSEWDIFTEQDTQSTTNVTEPPQEIISGGH